MLVGALALWGAGCGGDGPEERTTGILQGTIPWSGTWPEAGYLILALFITAPWDPDYTPGPPAAFRLVSKPANGTASFLFDNPQLAFGTYETLILAWKDPDDTNARTNYHSVSIYGTTLEAKDQAKPLVLDPHTPDQIGLVLPEAVLYQASAEMLAHYPSL
jgi:hypothetical protein